MLGWRDEQEGIMKGLTYLVAVVVFGLLYLACLALWRLVPVWNEWAWCDKAVNE